jgi:putative protease
MTELLAPAGSLDNVMTAINAGADAIYLGGKLFNARKFAHNLDAEELAQAVRTAHIFGVKIYVTVNILMADTELADVEAYLKQLDALCVDGIIVQDLAVAAIARRVAPALPLHGSTQMTVADLSGVRFLEKLGFTQVVLSRELSVQEIEYICAHATAKIEVFVHGASCMSYSGQCLMSSFIGGRSGNRGSCAQPCRLPYTMLEGKDTALTAENKYLLSLKDLNSISLIDVLMDAGVASFKIEGRMKGNGYVNSVVQAYKMVRDGHKAAPQKRQKLLSQAERILAESFNRTYQQDFLADTVGRATITEQSAGNQGQHVGHILNCHDSIARAMLDEPLQAGDLIKIVSHDGRECIDEIFSVTDNDVNHKKPFTLELRRKDGFAGELYRLARSEDRDTSAVEISRKRPLYFHADTTENGCLRLTGWDEEGHSGEIVSDYVVQKANKRPADRTWLQQQLNRLGGTVFEVADVTIWDESYMIPASVINDLRRQAVQALEQAILAEYERPQAGSPQPSLPGSHEKAGADHQQIVVRCDSLDGVEAALRGGADRIIFGGDSYDHHVFDRKQWQQAVQLAHTARKQIWAASPRILRQRDVAGLSEELQAAVRSGIDGIYAGAMGIMAMAEAEKWQLPIVADWSLNIFNSEAARAFVDSGCSSLTVSTELMLRQIKKIVASCNVPIETVVQGRLEMMVTEYCSIAACAGSGNKQACAAPCRGRKFYLKDRRDELFPVVTDQYCRNHILNSRDLDLAPYYDELARAGIRRLRIEGRGRSAQWIETQTKRYRRLCDGTEQMLLGKEDQTVTRGHYFHGIL